MHPTNRGVALYGERVYIATEDAFVVALDAATGELVWETAVANYEHGYYCTLAPLAAQGKIMVGVFRRRDGHSRVRHRGRRRFRRYRVEDVHHPRAGRART